MADSKPSITILGGTGALGAGLALRWAIAGYPVIIGSRSAERAAEAAKALAERVKGASVSGDGNAEAAAKGDTVVMTVPWENHGPTIAAVKDAVQGKIFVDVTVPLVPPRVSRVHLPPEGSAAKTSQILLGENVQVTSAFHNIAAAHLQDLEHEIDSDVLVFGDKKAARDEVLKLVEAAGMKGWHGGPIDNSVVGEALTAMLIHINRSYKIDGAGIRITGTPSGTE
jgi:NADPH-dependent F420 reductase